MSKKTQIVPNFLTQIEIFNQFLFHYGIYIRKVSQVVFPACLSIIEE